MRWFGRSSKAEPGWLAIAMDERKLSFVHGIASGSGKATVTRFGATKIDPRGSAGEKIARHMAAGRHRCSTLLRPGEYQLLLVEAPPVPPAELKSAIRWRVKDLLDYHVDDATMDVLDIPPESDLAGRGHSMYAVAARNQVIEERIRAFEEARIPLSVIDIPETAQRNISALQETDGRAAALLYFREDSGLLTVTCRSELYFARRVEIGMSQILGRAVEERADLFERIGLELQRTFDHFDRQFRYVPIAKVLLGAEPQETGLFEHLKENLDIAVERVDLVGNISFNGHGTPDAATQWQLFHLIGAALRHEAKVL